MNCLPENNGNTNNHKQTDRRRRRCGGLVFRRCRCCSRLMRLCVFNVLIYDHALRCFCCLTKYLYNNNDELISLSFLSGLHPCDVIICRVRVVNRHFGAEWMRALRFHPFLMACWNQMRNSKTSNKLPTHLNFCVFIHCDDIVIRVW